MSALNSWRGWLITILIAGRVAAALVIGFGPWTDEASELQGWDAERFAMIAADDRTHWADAEIEYPPGSVVIFEAVHRIGDPSTVGGPNVVGMNRSLVVLGLIADLLAVGLLWRSISTTAALAYLILGTPLLPMGYLRLDLVTATMGLAALLLLSQRSSGRDRRTFGLASLGFGSLVALGASIKLWPVLLIAAAVRFRRWSHVAYATAGGLVLAAAWLIWAAAGFNPVAQVTALRGATGWHVESTVGALVAMFTEETARLELNAFRIGSLDPLLVALGRVLIVGYIGFIIVRPASLRRPAASKEPERRSNPPATTDAAAAVLGSLAMLLGTSALLSPQFLLWLVPFAALCLAERQTRHLGLMAGGAFLLTGATLAAYGPSGVDQPVPALLLTVRNLSLFLVAAACLRHLNQRQRLVE